MNHQPIVFVRIESSSPPRRPVARMEESSPVTTPRAIALVALVLVLLLGRQLFAAEFAPTPTAGVSFAESAR